MCGPSANEFERLRLAYVAPHGVFLPNQIYNISTVRPSFMGIVFGSGILLDLVLFANRIIAEPKS